MYCFFLGLAVNLDTFLEHKTLAVSTSSKSGYLENDFLSQLVSSKYELEAKADNCMKVCVCVCTRVCVRACMHACVYVRVCACICILV